MPFHLITGIPGHGKTSLMMEMLVEAAEANAKALKTGKPILADEKGNALFSNPDGSPLLERPIYCAGIDGLVDGLGTVLEDPTRWQDLPDGALIFVDECWKWFGHLEDAQRKPPPPHVQGIAEHRHRGMDFVATSQGPRQIYPFMRPLIGPHWHVVRRFGTPMIDVYKWGELAEDPQSQGMRERGQKETRTLPTKQRKLWKSAAAHTIKPRIPFKIIAAVIGCLVAVPLLWMGVQRMRPEAIAKIGKEAAPEKARLAGPSGATGDGPSSGQAEHVMTPAEWQKQLEPRILGVHGSQPIFDGRKAKSEPATYCMLSNEKYANRCVCFTEQATVIPDILPATCRQWARYGRYDPFRTFAASSSSSSNGSSESRGQAKDPGVALDASGQLRADLVQALELEAQGRSAAPANGPIEIPGAIRLP